MPAVWKGKFSATFMPKCRDSISEHNCTFYFKCWMAQADSLNISEKEAEKAPSQKVGPCSLAMTEKDTFSPLVKTTARHSKILCRLSL
jgi:hypothetical protein